MIELYQYHRCKPRFKHISFSFNEKIEIADVEISINIQIGSTREYTKEGRQIVASHTCIHTYIRVNMAVGQDLMRGKEEDKV